MIFSAPARMPRVIAVVLTVLMLAACAPAPERPPTPPPAFASEEEAFAAAEETYRAYNDAVNAERSGRQGENPRGFLSGDLLQRQIDSEQELANRGIVIRGDTQIVKFVGVSADVGEPVSRIEAVVCLNVSQARATNSQNEDVTSPERAALQAVSTIFVGSSESLSITEYQPKDGYSC